MERSTEEEEIRLACLEKAGKSTTEAWGPLREALERHVGVARANPISVPRTSERRRALFSPGGAKDDVDVTGFMVHPAADMETVIAEVRAAMETLPFPRTVVMMDGADGWYPSHVISTEPDVGHRAHVAYPNAVADLDVVKRLWREGPWAIEFDGGDSFSAASPTVELPVEGLARLIMPGDGVLMRSGGEVIGIGTVGLVGPVTSKMVRLTLDRLVLDPAPGASAQSDGVEMLSAGKDSD